MSDAIDSDTPPQILDDDENISILDILVVLAKHKRLVLGLPLVAAVVAAVVSLLLPNVYTATAKILPPQQGQSSAMILGQLGGLAALPGTSGLIKNPSDMYVSMIKSRTVADNLVQRFALMTVYGKRTVTGARQALHAATTVISGKDGVITIEVEDQDTKRAAALANGYVDELHKLNQTLALTEAAQRRLFFEKQLRAEKDELANAEVALKKTQETTGLIKLDDQGKAIIESVARLQAQVAIKEVQIGAMRVFATDQNAELISAQRELQGLRTQLARVQREKIGDGELFVAAGRIPEAGLEYIRKYREVKYHEAVFELIAKQYEVAKIDEARDSSLVQVMDAAIEPEQKSKPKRFLLVLLTMVIAAIVSVASAIVFETLDRAHRKPRTAERLSMLRRYLTSR